MKTSRLIGGSVGSLAAKLVGAVAALGYNVALARSLGPEHYGVFGLSFAFFSVAVTLSRVGLDYVVLRRIAVARRADDEASVEEIFTHAGAIVLFWALLAGVVLAVASGLIAGWMDVPELAVSLMKMSVGIPFWAVAWVWAEGLKGAGAPVRAAVVEFATINTAALLAFLVAADQGLAWASWTPVVAAVSALALCMVFWYRAEGGRLPVAFHLRWAVSRELMVAGAPLLVVAATNLIVMWTDLVMLGWMGDAASVGLYNAALKLATAISFILVAVSGVVSPVFARAADAGDAAQVWKFFKRGGAVALGIAGPVALAVFVAPEFFLSLFGSEYAPIAGPLRILVSGQLLHAILGLSGYLLVMAGGEREMQRRVVFAAALNVVGNAVLIPRFGTFGAASATTLSIVVMDVATLMAARTLIQRKVGR